MLVPDPFKKIAHGHKQELMSAALWAPGISMAIEMAFAPEAYTSWELQITVFVQTIVHSFAAKTATPYKRRSHILCTPSSVHMHRKI